MLKLKASTILENVVALTIIMTVIGAMLLIFNQMQSSDRLSKRMDLYLNVDRVINEAALESKLQNETIENGDQLIIKTVVLEDNLYYSVVVEGFLGDDKLLERSKKVLKR